jgi:cell division GTPase FtsZ
MEIHCIGVGNTGCVLASKFSKNPMLFSTAHQDTVNFSSQNVFSFSNEGASKRFKNGLSIWSDNEEKLRKTLSSVQNKKVVVFASLGGGSGSSSLNIISKILLENKNKILLVGIVPYKKEQNPPLSNFVLAI